MSNRLYILLDAFLIEVFPLYSIVFTYSYYRGPLLGVVLVDARECEPPSFDVCLPYNAYILGGFSRCFLGFFLVSFGLFRPGTVRAPPSLTVRNYIINVVIYFKFFSISSFLLLYFVYSY